MPHLLLRLLLLLIQKSFQVTIKDTILLMVNGPKHKRKMNLLILWMAKWLLHNLIQREMN